MKRRSFYSAIFFLLFTLALVWGNNEKVMAACQHKAASGYIVTKAATCGASGTQVRKCTKCGYALETKTIPALGHKWDSGAVTKAATCESKGSRTYRCTRGNCHGERKADIAALGHSASSSYVTTKAATCTAKGTKARKCTRCSKNIETKPIDALGHKWDSGTVTNKPTCTAKGTKKFRCTRSGCNGTKTDSINATGHSASSNYVIIQAATCTTNGIQAKKCTKCNTNMDTKPINATGHSMDAGTVTKAATCTANGTLVRKCKNSGCTYSEPSTIAKKNHTPASTYYINRPATCLVDGLQERRCTVCNETVERHVLPAPKKHTPASTYYINKPATCLVDGLQERKCTVCNETIERNVIKAYGKHRPASSYIITKQPTCQTAGTKIRVCTECGEHIETVNIPASSEYHQLEEYTNDLSVPTTASTGMAFVHCKLCNYIKGYKVLPRIKNSSSLDSQLIDKSLAQIRAFYGSGRYYEIANENFTNGTMVVFKVQQMPDKVNDVFDFVKGKVAVVCPLVETADVLEEVSELALHFCDDDSDWYFDAHTPISCSQCYDGKKILLRVAEKGIEEWGIDPTKAISESLDESGHKVYKFLFDKLSDKLKGKIKDEIINSGKDPRLNDESTDRVYSIRLIYDRKAYEANTSNYSGGSSSFEFHYDKNGNLKRFYHYAG